MTDSFCVWQYKDCIIGSFWFEDNACSRIQKIFKIKRLAKIAVTTMVAVHVYFPLNLFSSTQLHYFCHSGTIMHFAFSLYAYNFYILVWCCILCEGLDMVT